MIQLLYRLLFMIRNSDHIPPLPSVYRSAYNVHDVSKKEWDVMIKMGARDPHGIRVVMRRHNIDSVEKLYDILEFYKAQRRPLARLQRALTRLSGGYKKDPHADEIRKYVVRKNVDTLSQRIKRYHETEIK